jgi:antagonist of KipI
MSLQILKPGLQTTIQDDGRQGYQSTGVIVSGAMDQYSFRLANLLVGNHQEEGALEIQLLGPTITFTTDCLIAITGADFQARIDGQTIGMGRPIAVTSGTVLTFKNATIGKTGYLAISGGFDIPIEMGSKSTYLRANIGGYHGRALQKGDAIPLHPMTDKGQYFFNQLMATRSHSFSQANWFIAGSTVSKKDLEQPISVMLGIEAEAFTEETKQKLFNTRYLITTSSDRMGYRLEGETLKLKEPLELVSEIVNIGAIQVPAEGNPIILMADHQTTAGYPIIGQVSKRDISRLAQMKPGDYVHFSPISNDESENLYIEKEHDIDVARIAINNQ